MDDEAQRLRLGRLRKRKMLVEKAISSVLLAAALAGGPARAGDLADLFSGLAEPFQDTGLDDDVMEMPTLGGRLFWGDVIHFRGWRIQENVLTKHFRLLDPQDRRHCSGTLDDCAAKLDEIKKDRGLEPLSGTAVVFVHGMGRSSKSWPALAKRVEEAGHLVVAFDYPSTRCSIAESADYLAEVIGSLDGIERIDIVAHSMGGLVSRAYLANHRDPRLHRLVMLGVPNLGAEMADKVVAIPLYQWVCGPGGCELVTDPNGLIASLPTPDFEFAIVAGGKGTLGGYNPLIPGDDDGTVTVASTRLPGAADFILVEGALHSFMMFDDRIVDATMRFLETGGLRVEGEKRPIPQKVEAAAGNQVEGGEPIEADPSR